jgi:hypothetical protein
MPFILPQGIRIANSDMIDDRLVFDTVAEALEGVGKPRRYDGLALWIRGEGRTYRFIGGIEDNNFVPDSVSGGPKCWSVD